jgi:filamentous hemagglutinin
MDVAGSLPRIRGTQIGLRDPQVVARIKLDMLAGRFAYQELSARIAGVRDRSGVYHVMVGHHRMAAAREIHRETNDPTPVRNLLHWGFWDEVSRPPSDSRPLPSRYWWGALRNWLGF